MKHVLVLSVVALLAFPVAEVYAADAAVKKLALHVYVDPDHVDAEIKRPTPGGIPESPEPSNLYLQAHGHPSFYRNIWLLEKK